MSPKQKIGLAASLAIVIMVGLAGMWWLSEPVVVEQPEVIPEETPVTETTPAVTEQVIGNSVNGREINAFTLGNGERRLLFVGGIHGGYEWNSTLLAYEMLDYLSINPNLIPADVTVTIIPVLNPDGLFDIIGKEGRFAAVDVPEATAGKVGRFNGNDVDLNRNFDCKWQPKSTWRGQTVDAGTAPFSEPEAAALRDYVAETEPDGVIFWHSQANAVYASECEAGILPDTRTLMNLYAKAAGYPAVDVFGAYPVTGDAEGWLASIGIPAITVELSSRTSIEWTKNLAGVESLLTSFAK